MSQQPKANGQSQTPSQSPGPAPAAATATASAGAAVPAQSQTPTPGPQQQQQRQMGAHQQRSASQNGTQLDLSQLQPAQVQILLNQMNNCQKEAQRLGDTPAGKEQFFKYQRIKMLLQQYHQIKQSQAGGSASPNLQANRQLTPQQQQQQQQKSQSPQLQQQQKTQMQLQQAKMQQAQQVQPGQAAQDQQTPQRNVQIQPNQQQANLMRNQTSSPSPGVAPNKPVGGGPASNAGTPQSSQTPKLTALQQYRQLQGVLPEFVKRLEKIEISKKSGNLPPDQLAKLIEQENTVRTRYNSYKKVMNTLEQQLKEQHNNRGSPQITPAGTPFQQPSSQSQGSQQYPQVQQPQAQQQQQQQQIQNQMQQNSIQMQNQSRPPSAQQGAQPQAQVQAQRAMMYQKQMAAKGNNGNNLPQNQIPPQQQLTPQQTPQQSQQQLTPAQRKQQQQQQSRTGTPQIPDQNNQSQTQVPAPAPATQTPGVVNNRGSAGAKSQSPSTPITNVNAAARPTSNNMANGGPISTSNTTVFKSSIPSAAVSQTVTAKPSVPVAPPASNASLSGGSAISAPSLTTPALLKLPPYEMQGDRVLAKRKLSELVKTVGADEGDGETVIDGDVEELLLDLADEFVTNVTSFACRLAKHRKSENLQSKDVQLHLEKNYNIRIPGYASDDIRSVRKWVSNGQHATRVQGIEISKSVEQNK
ncbi:hypothetical protein WICPIJ_001723 [Wickerhamomyces pijperi]|uniref:TBP-associated factor 12 n=1 Tax=Wickerhamomyces pijperi TaxID=599730 RepID=A0A9P8QCR3_WICPI|nr:hypothetical protein WICPIJ_001723 [Wickerhamomyces pijperi]